MATSQQGEARTRAGRLCWQLTAPELVWTALGRPSSGLQGIRFTAPGIFPWRPQLMCPLKRSRGVGRSLPCNRAPVSHRVKLRFTQADSVQRTLKFPSESSVRKKKNNNKKTSKPPNLSNLFACQRANTWVVGLGRGKEGKSPLAPTSHMKPLMERTWYQPLGNLGPGPGPTSHPLLVLRELPCPGVPRFPCLKVNLS